MIFRGSIKSSSCWYVQGASMADWLWWLALKLLAPLHCGSGLNPMSGSCQLLTEGCWFTSMNNMILQMWKLTTIYNQKRLKNGVKHEFTSPQYAQMYINHVFLLFSGGMSEVIHWLGNGVWQAPTLSLWGVYNIDKNMVYHICIDTPLNPTPPTHTNPLWPCLMKFHETAKKTWHYHSLIALVLLVFQDNIAEFIFLLPKAN